MKLEPKAKKRLSILAAATCSLAIIIAGVFVYRRYAVHRELAGIKAAGIMASDSGDHVRAVEQLSRYLHRRADDPEAMRYYARSRMAAANSNDLQAAADVVAVLQSLSQFGPLNVDEHHRLMELYGLLRNDSGVTHEADRLLGISANDKDALKAKSLALLRQRDWPAAVATAGRWSQAAPMDIEAQSCDLSALLQSGATPNEVIGKAAALRRTHPNDPRFELLESLALTQTGQHAEPPELAKDAPSDPRSAIDWAKTAASRNQPDAICAHLLVDQLDRLALFDESLALLRKQIAADGDPVSRQALARRLWVSGLWTDLAAFLADTLKAGTKADGESICLYGVAQSRLGRTEEVARSTNLLEQKKNDPVATAWLCVLKQLTTGTDRNARQLLECYEGVLGFDSENPFFQFFLADALNRIGEGDLAAEHLKVASSRLVTWATPSTRLSELLLRQGRSEAALISATQAQFREVHSGKNRDLSVAIALGRAWLACLTAGRTNDEAGLAKLAGAVQQIAPGEEQSLAIQIALMTRAKDRAGAKDALAKAIHSPQKLSQSALLNYAAISQRSGLELENECFDRYQRQYGETVDLAYAQAIRALSDGNGNKGLALLNESRDRLRKRGGADDDIAWKIATARYLDVSGDNGARAAWVAIADVNPENLALQEFALSARSTRSDRDLMDRTIERVHKLTGDGAFVWRLARARWLLDGSAASAASRKDAEDASRILSAMIRVCPECVEARLMMASCQQKLQNLDGAIEQLYMATRLLPDSADLAMQLVSLFEERNDFAQVRRVLLPFTAGPLTNPVALVALGWLQEHDGNSSAAEQSYRHALATRPDMVAAQNNLAMILVNKGSDGDVQEALSLANKATTADPHSGPLFDTLAAAQAKSHDYDAALASIAKAITLSGSNPSFKLHQVELLVEAGRKDAARAAFGQIEPLLSDSTSNVNKDSDLTSRLRKMQDTLAIAAKPRKI